MGTWRRISKTHARTVGDNGLMLPVEEVPPVVVWGNCQAAPIAALLTEPLQAHGWGVRPVAPVFEIDAQGLADVHELMARAAVLVTQPVRDEYSIPGCGSAQLSALMKAADARVVTIPVTYDSSAFPYQVNAHGAGWPDRRAPDGLPRPTRHRRG